MSAKIPAPPWTTPELANATRHKPQTVLKHHSQNGHFMGIVPTKVGRMLLWPDTDCRRIVFALDNPGKAARPDKPAEPAT